MLKEKIMFLIILTAAAVLPAGASSVTDETVEDRMPPGFITPLQDTGGPILYTIEPPADPMIDFYIAEYSSETGQKTMAAILERGAPYLGFIYNRLVEADMPPELMFLPAIESGFRAWAVSRS